MEGPCLFVVMPALDPGIHSVTVIDIATATEMDYLVKPGNDDIKC